MPLQTLLASASRSSQKGPLLLCMSREPLPTPYSCFEFKVEFKVPFLFKSSCDKSSTLATLALQLACPAP